MTYPPHGARWLPLPPSFPWIPNIVIFDEPTTGQDAVNVARIANVIAELRKRGKTVITITHDIDFCAENFERVIAMSQGKILLDGKVNDVLGQEDILATTYVDPPQLTRLGKRLGFRNDCQKSGRIPERVEKMTYKDRSDCHAHYASEGSWRLAPTSLWDKPSILRTQNPLQTRVCRLHH